MYEQDEGTAPRARTSVVAPDAALIIAWPIIAQPPMPPAFRATLASPWPKRRQAGSLWSALARASVSVMRLTPTSSCPCACRARPMRTASAALGRSCRRSKRSARRVRVAGRPLRDRLSDRGARRRPDRCLTRSAYTCACAGSRPEPKIVAAPAGLAAGWECTSEDEAAHTTARARAARSLRRTCRLRTRIIASRLPTSKRPRRASCYAPTRQPRPRACGTSLAARGDATRRPAARDRPFQVVRFDWALLPHRRHPRPRAGWTGCSAGSNEKSAHQARAATRRLGRRRRRAARARAPARRNMPRLPRNRAQLLSRPTSEWDGV